MTTLKFSNVAAIAAVVLCTTTVGFGLRQALSQQSDDNPFGAAGGSGLVLDQGADAAGGAASGDSANPVGVAITSSGATGDSDDPFGAGEGGAANSTATTNASAQRPAPSAAFDMKGLGEAQLAITRALEEVADLQYVDTPFDVAMEDLSTRYNMHIELDRNALTDVGIDPSTVVNANYRGITLRTALRLFLDSLELTYIIEDEYLLITTEDVADQRLDTRIYPIRPQWAVTINDLTSAITTTVAPESWDINGGPGSAAPLGNNLVISQTQECHEEIVELLKQLERAAEFRAEHGYPATSASGGSSAAGAGTQRAGRNGGLNQGGGFGTRAAPEESGASGDEAASDDGSASTGGATT